MNRNICLIFVVSGLLLTFNATGSGQTIKTPPVEKWVTAQGTAAGTDLKAKDQAIAKALRNAVEQACGLFIRAQSKTRDYKLVYERVLGNTAGYVIEYKVAKTEVKDGVYHAKVRACVSTKKFEENWAAIAHIVQQESNPRVIIAIAEATYWSRRGRWAPYGPDHVVKEAGAVQAKLEDFFLDKGILLVDRAGGEKVSKRDILLAGVKESTAEVAALGARFKADVVITGKASAKYGNQLEIAGATMYQYVANLSVRAVRTDSAQIMVSKNFGPVTTNTLQRMGGEDKALVKLAEQSAPKLLEAVVQAWRKQVHVTRNIALNIFGMDYKTWKLFQAEAKKLRGVQGLRRREITESVANIDVEYDYDIENLADKITELKGVKLQVTEISANRIKLRVVKRSGPRTQRASPDAQRQQ